MQFASGSQYAIIGPNGSGKSTLLKIISGNLTPSSGSVMYAIENRNIPVEEIYRYVTYTAPYIEMIEEFTVAEAITFHFRFKSCAKGLTIAEVPGMIALEGHENKFVKNLSSGMKQRLKTGLTILSESPILLLDEPTTNLDAEGIVWYNNMINRFGHNRIVIIASNIEREYAFCSQVIQISQYASV